MGVGEGSEEVESWGVGEVFGVEGVAAGAWEARRRRVVDGDGGSGRVGRGSQGQGGGRVGSGLVEERGGRVFVGAGQGVS